MLSQSCMSFLCQVVVMAASSTHEEVSDILLDRIDNTVAIPTIAAESKVIAMAESSERTAIESEVTTASEIMEKTNSESEETMTPKDPEYDVNGGEKSFKRIADGLSEEESPESKKHKWKKMWDEVDYPPNLSKRQKKKYIRNVLWETKWKPLRRAKEKEKLKQKKLQARLNDETLSPSRKQLKGCKMALSNCKLRIAIDFSFDELMSQKDIGKCLKQLNHCYCLNRRVTNPLQLYVMNFSGKSRDQMASQTEYTNWDVNFHEDNYLNVFAKEDLVYLTSDSDNVLTELDVNKVYIIGALVDHNRFKGKTLSIALNQEICHAQLPIGEYIQMNTRKVLTIDHVFHILLYVSEGLSWKEAFLKVIPQRKGAVEKTTLDV